MDYLWIIVMFLSGVGLSFWRHPFTAEDPLESKWCIAKFLQIFTDKKKTHQHFGWHQDEYIFIFGWTIPLTTACNCFSMTVVVATLEPILVNTKRNAWPQEQEN